MRKANSTNLLNLKVLDAMRDKQTLRELKLNFIAGASVLGTILIGAALFEALWR